MTERLARIERLIPDILILLDAMATQQRDEYARSIAADLRAALDDGNAPADRANRARNPRG